MLLACARIKARVYGEQHSSSLLTLDVLRMTQKKLGKLEEGRGRQRSSDVRLRRGVAGPGASGDPLLPEQPRAGRAGR